MKKPWKAYLVIAMGSVGCLAMQAQQIVHAVSGVVTAAHPAVNQIVIQTNDGSDNYFKYKKDLNTDIDFDRAVRDGTVKPESFNKIGDHVIAYYFGEGSERTVVGLKDF